MNPQQRKFSELSKAALTSAADEKSHKLSSLSTNEELLTLRFANPRYQDVRSKVVRYISEEPECEITLKLREAQQRSIALIQKARQDREIQALWERGMFRAPSGRDLRVQVNFDFRKAQNVYESSVETLKRNAKSIS